MTFNSRSLQKNLNKILSALFLVWMFIVTAGARASAQHLYPTVNDINLADTTAVLQKCLSLPLIDHYFTKNSTGTVKQIYIMQYPVKFPPAINVSRFNQPVLFRSRAEIRSEKAEVFLIFKTFSISGDEATAVFTLNSDYKTHPAMIEVSLSLHRSGTQWTVTNHQIKRLL